MFGRLKKPSRSGLDPITGLWAWIAANQTRIFEELRRLETPGSQTELVITQLGARLKKISPALVHEIGLATPDRIEVVISADGDRTAFPLVIETVKQAPAASWLKATAFRQRNPGIAIRMFGREVGPDNMTYLSRPDGDRLGLDVFIDAELEDQQRAMAGFVMLDQTLGEYDVEMALGSIDFHPGRPAHARPLDELAAEVDRLRPETLN